MLSEQVPPDHYLISTAMRAAFLAGQKVERDRVLDLLKEQNPHMTYSLEVIKEMIQNER